MKVLGYIFLGLCLVTLGIVVTKLGWYDYVVNWLNSFAR